MIADHFEKIKFVDINKKESEIEVKDIKTLSAHVEKLKEKFIGLVHMRVPICNSGAPSRLTSTLSLIPWSAAPSTRPSS